MTESKKISAPLVLGVAAAMVLVGVVGGRAFSNRATQGAEAPAGKVQGAAKVSHKRFMVPVTMSQPAKGPGDALVTIVEWCDVRGAACAAVDAPMASLLKKYDTKLRWVYRQLPDPTRTDTVLVNSFARGALLQSGKFWEVRELLLKQPADKVLTDADLKQVAEQAGLDWSALSSGLEKKEFHSTVAADLRFAKMFGVSTGPSFFVNGRPVPTVAAADLEKTLQPIIEQELAEASWHVQNGVAAADVYNTIIKDAAWNVDDDPSKRAGKPQPQNAVEAYKAAQAAQGH